MRSSARHAPLTTNVDLRSSRWPTAPMAPCDPRRALAQRPRERARRPRNRGRGPGSVSPLRPSWIAAARRRLRRATAPTCRRASPGGFRAQPRTSRDPRPEEPPTTLTRSFLETRASFHEAPTRDEKPLCVARLTRAHAMTVGAPISTNTPADTLRLGILGHEPRLGHDGPK